MQKIAVIVNSDSFNWLSCNAISSNLHTAVRKIDAKKTKKQFFSVSPADVYSSIHWGCDTLKKMLDEVVQFDPDVIYLPDHLPHPSQILIPLLQLDPRMKSKKFIVHAYGDFSIYPDLWQLLGNEMQGLKLSILTASTKQSSYIDFFLRSSVNTPRVIPFPIDKDGFKFSMNRRKSMRKKLKIKDQEKVFIYTGRISLQKNIDAAISAFSLIEKKDKNVRLLIVGDFDDLGSPNLGHVTHQGYLFQKIDSLLQELSDPVRAKINFLGSQPRNCLSDYLFAADLFISLSTYHDEDYGMSPAEALAAGLPAILTDWGGYSDFAFNSQDVELIEVKLISDDVAIELGDVLKAADILLKSKNLREHRAKKFFSTSSVEAVAAHLENEFFRQIPPFAGFNFKLKQWIEEQKARFAQPINTGADSLYNELYRRYAEKSQ